MKFENGPNELSGRHLGGEAERGQVPTSIVLLALLSHDQVMLFYIALAVFVAIAPKFFDMRYLLDTVKLSPRIRGCF